MRQCIKGFTLVELVLALGLSALIIVPMSMAFQLSLGSWEDYDKSSEVLQHGRVALTRMCNELRHAVKLNLYGSGYFEFYTRTLIDSDYAPERIRYAINNSLLERSVDGGSAAILAGSSTNNIDVAELELTPYKRNTAGNLVELVYGTDEPDLACATLVSARITANGSGVNTDMVFESMVWFQNR